MSDASEQSRGSVTSSVPLVVAQTSNERRLMRKAGVAATVVFYSLIVFFGVVLLAAAQLRSSGDATFDTWRLNYDANRLVNFTLVRDLKKAEEGARENENSYSINQECLRLFDENGLPKAKVVEEQTAKEVAEARQQRTPIDSLSGDVYCLVKGYTLLQNDMKYFGLRTKQDTAEITELKKSMTSNGEQYTELIKGRQDFLAFKEMEDLWYQRPFIVVPYDLLVLLLVMLMGALGGMVRLLRDYGATDRPNPTGDDYFFVPLIGAVVAIGGYILAKTGLLLLSISERREFSESVHDQPRRNRVRAPRKRGYRYHRRSRTEDAIAPG